MRFHAEGGYHAKLAPAAPPDAVRAVIESIKLDARAKGWPAELLWNNEFWGSPRGLAALLDEERRDRGRWD
jgi:hypothetical protein